MRGSRWLAIVILVGSGLFPIGCRQPASPDADAGADPTTGADAEELDRRIVLENVTLDQNDEAGQLLWQVSAAKAAYSPDREKVELDTLTGNFYENAELAIQIRAQQGTVIRDGEEILLKGDIVAVDPRNEVTIRAEEARWQPDRDRLTVRRNLTGNHPRIDVTAREAIYSADTQELKLRGEIEAIAREPDLILQTELAIWEIAAERVRSEAPVQIDRLDGENVSTDRVVADRADVDLSTERILLEGNVESRSVEPPVRISSEAVTWDTVGRVIETETPVRILYDTDELDITGNRGRFDLAAEVATLSGGVAGSSPARQAEISAERLEWNIPQQQVQAWGNVIYQQQDPPLVAQGDRAIGNLQTQEISVRSDSGQAVVSEIQF